MEKHRTLSINLCISQYDKAYMDDHPGRVLKKTLIDDYNVSYPQIGVLDNNIVRIDLAGSGVIMCDGDYLVSLYKQIRQINDTSILIRLSEIG
jgi:hypothetical protein